MKQIVGINHVGLRVRNLETTRSFYELLGFVFLMGPVGPEPIAVMEHPSGVNINFILNAAPGSSPENILMDVPDKHPGFTHVALEVEDLEAVRQQLDDHQIAITGTGGLPDGTAFIFIRDPDGNVIELHKPV